MNNQRRDVIRELSVKLRKVAQEVYAISLQEGEAFDNMPEGLQDTERGERMEYNATELEDISEELIELLVRLNEVIQK